MKVGIRTPNLKKSIKARTTGKMKRAVNKSINPLYGQKGMGYVNNPKKAVYNKVYDKTTIDAVPRAFNNADEGKDTKNKTVREAQSVDKDEFVTDTENNTKTEGIIFLLLSIVFYILFIAFTVFIINTMMKYPLARKTPMNYITMAVLLGLAIIFKKIYRGYNNK